MMSQAVMDHVLERWHFTDSTIARLADLLKCPPSEVLKQIAALEDRVERLKQTAERLVLP